MMRDPLPVRRLSWDPGYSEDTNMRDLKLSIRKGMP